MTHGTRYAYRRGKCRCGECRAWASAEWQRYRRSRERRGIPRPNGWDSYNGKRPYAAGGT